MKKQLSKVRILSGITAVAAIGMAILPMGAYAATNSTNLQVNATIGTSISITHATGTLDFTVTPNAANDATGGTLGTGTTAFTVATNNVAGYDVSIKNNDSDLNLVSGTNNIASTTAAWGSCTALNNAWGFNVGTTATAFCGTTAVDQNIYSKTSASVAGGDTLNLTFGASVLSNQAPGTYTDTVVLTATTK